VAQKWWTLTQRNQIVITVGLIVLAWVVNTPRLL
jgi:glucose dehydrogenase